MTMRVPMTADTVGGVWTYACELIKALESHDVEITLATMGAPPSKTGLATLDAAASSVSWPIFRRQSHDVPPGTCHVRIVPSRAADSGQAAQAGSPIAPPA